MLSEKLSHGSAGREQLEQSFFLSSESSARREFFFVYPEQIQGRVWCAVCKK